MAARNIALGQRVKDSITGFTGTVTGLVSYIAGCDQALVAPDVDKQGKLADSAWFDTVRLEVTKMTPIKLPGVALQPIGSDRPAPRR